MNQLNHLMVEEMELFLIIISYYHVHKAYKWQKLSLSGSSNSLCTFNTFHLSAWSSMTWNIWRVNKRENIIYIT